MTDERGRNRRVAGPWPDRGFRAGVRSVDADMRRQPASMVYELLRMHVDRRLPGIEVDQGFLRDAAAKIAAGYPD